MNQPDPHHAFTTGPGWIRETPSLNKVALALVNAQSEVHTAGKTGNNTFDKYTYSKLEDYLSVAKPVLAKYKLALVLDAVEAETLEHRTTKNGGVEHAVRVKVRATVYHESGESLVFYGYGEGQDRADKAIYKALTGAKKYAVAGALAIPTSDDPEADEKVGLSTGAKSDKLDSAGNVKQRIPKWADDQVKEAGGYIGTIRELLVKSGKDMLSADVKIKEWRAAHKYDEPSDVIDALALWQRELEGNV